MSRERNTIFSLNKKNALITQQGLLYCKNSFAAEVTFDIKSKIWQRFLKQSAVVLWSFNLIILLHWKEFKGNFKYKD